MISIFYQQNFRNKVAFTINILQYELFVGSIYNSFRPSLYPLMQESFKGCFKNALKQGNKKISPCTRPIQMEECLQYCDWHIHYTKTRNFDEFLTLMKYGLPQRKWISNEAPEIEKKMARKLFGESNVIKGNLKSSQSPVPFSVLCERKQHGQDSGFMGENVGWLEPACNSFFPAPTDQGICMTENFNIQEVVQEKYDALTEPQLQKPSSKMEGETMWTRKTHIISSQSNDLIVRMIHLSCQGCLLIL